MIQPGQQNDLEVLQSEEVGMVERHSQLRLGIFLFVLNTDFQEQRRQVIRYSFTQYKAEYSSSRLGIACN